MQKYSWKSQRVRRQGAEEGRGWAEETSARGTFLNKPFRTIQFKLCKNFKLCNVLINQIKKKPTLFNLQKGQTQISSFDTDSRALKERHVSTCQERQRRDTPCAGPRALESETQPQGSGSSCAESKPRFCRLQPRLLADRLSRRKDQSVTSPATFPRSSDGFLGKPQGRLPAVPELAQLLRQRRVEIILQLA